MPQRASGAPPRTTGKPTKDNTILAEFPRTGPEGEPAALRIMVEPFNGKPILHVRQWCQTRDRRWVATKAGVTIRLNEIDATINALERAKLALLDHAAERIDPSHEAISTP